MRSIIRLALFGFAVAFVAACNGGSAAPRATGPAAMLILSGNNQVAQVAAPSFPQPVQGQLYRAPNGQVAFRWSDFLLPAKAEAGTTVTVNGAPITNAVVCWADVPGAPKMIPFSVCTNTDNNGKASFTLRPDTIAGLAKGQVHWDSSGVARVTDSVQATINAAAASATYSHSLPTVLSPDTLPVNAVTDQYGNAVRYRVIGDSIVHVAGDTAGTIAARVLSFAYGPDQNNRYLTVEDTTGAKIGVIRYFIGGSALSGVAATFVGQSCGVSVTNC